MNVLQISDMGPSFDEVLSFVKKVFKPHKVKQVKAEKYAKADVLVCGDWRILQKPVRSEPGGDVLAGVLDRGKAPATLIYVLLGKTELSRALKPRARGVPAVDGWRRVIKAGGRVIVLQVDRTHDWKKRPFTVEEAIAALPTIAPKSAVLWHEPAKRLAL